MIKTQFLQLLNIMQARGSTLIISNRRSFKQTHNVVTALCHHRGLHCTEVRGSEKDPKDESDVDSELKEAAVNVAKSLPGDWTKTADALLSQLNMSQSPKKGSLPEKTKDDTMKSSGKSSLLKTMTVGRVPVRSEDGSRKMRRRTDTSRTEFIQDRRMEEDSRERDGLFAMKRLGIFDVVKSAESCPQPVLGTGLWEDEDREKLKNALGGPPKNAFEEQIEMTRKGQLWTFPVDNEADLHEERQYKFTDHIFLDKHLSKFPRQGPIRQFMELVCVGLSKNPYWTVPEKIEHIQWYADYFREKQSILDKNLDEKHRMADNQRKMN